MPSKKDWLKGAGMGLMGYQKTVLENRRQAADELKSDRLYELGQGKLGTDRELMSLYRERDKRTETSDRQRREGVAIQNVQDRLDSILDPDDMAIQEYMQERAMIMKASADGMGEDMDVQLAEAEERYRANRTAALDPNTAQGQSYLAGMDDYLKKVNSVLKTGNRKLSRALGDDWEGDVTDYLFMNQGASDAFQMTEDEAAAQSIDDAEAAAAARDNQLNEVVPGGTRMDDRYLDWPSDKSPEVKPFSGVGKLFEGIGITKTRPLHERMGRPDPNAGGPLMPQTAPTRRLDIDPETGQLMTPGAGLAPR